MPVKARASWHVLLPLLLVALCLCACTTTNPAGVASYPETAPSPNGTIPTAAGSILAEGWQAVRNGQCDLAASKVRELGPYRSADPSGLLSDQMMELVLQIEHCSTIAGVTGQGPVSPPPPTDFHGAPAGIYRVTSGAGKTLAEFQADLQYCEQFNEIPEQGIACEIDRGNTIFNDKTGAAYSRQRLQASLPVPLPAPPPPSIAQASPQPAMPLENPMGTMFTMAVAAVPSALEDCAGAKLLFGGSIVGCVGKDVVVQVAVGLGKRFVYHEICQNQAAFMQTSLIPADYKSGIVADACQNELSPE